MASELTVEKIRREFLNFLHVMEGAFLNDDEKEDIEKSMDELIKVTGGWEKLHEGVLVGIKNGISMEKQFELIKTFFEKR